MRGSVQESQRMQNFSSQLVSMNQVYCSLNSFLSNENGFYMIKKCFTCSVYLEIFSTEISKFIRRFLDQIIFAIFAKFFDFKVLRFLYSGNVSQVTIMWFIFHGCLKMYFKD